MRILVTGGTGFIGTAFCQRMLTAGHRVSVLSRNPERAERHFGGRVRATESLSGPLSIDPPEVIVNLAGANIGSARWTRKRKRNLIRSRVETTEHVVEYIAKAERRPRLLISGSAVGYYGARGDADLTEDAPPGDEFQSELCRQWEAAAMAATIQGVRVCISRTGVVMGAGGGALSGLVPQFCRGFGAYVGTGGQWLSWIHMEDLLDLFERFMDRDHLEGPFNNTAPHPITNHDFAHAIAAALHKRVRGRVPGPLLRVIMGEMAHLYLTGQRVLPHRHLKDGAHFRYADMHAALANVLGPENCT